MRPQQLLSHVAGLLQCAPAQRRAAGAGFGVPASIELTTRRARRRHVNWTHVTAELPAPYPLALHLHEVPWRARVRISGLEPPLPAVGSPAFESRFEFEAAPADVVGALLTPQRLARIIAYPQFELTTLPGARPVLALGFAGWPETEVEAEAALRLIVELAFGVREAYAALEAEVPPRQAGAPFREHEDGSGERLRAAQRQREVESVEHARRVREEHLAHMSRVIGAIMVFVALCSLMWAFGNLR